jgi:hypothetical protein
LTRCLAGLVKRRLQDLNVRIVGHQPPTECLEHMLPPWCQAAIESSRGRKGPAEIELALGNSGAFSRSADCRILVVPPGQLAPPALTAQADLIFSDRTRGALAPSWYAMQSFDRVLQEQLGLQVILQQPRVHQLPAESLALPIAA